MFDIPLNFTIITLSAIGMVVLSAIWYYLIFKKACNTGSEQDAMQPVNKIIIAFLIMAVCSFIMMFMLANSIIFMSYYLDISGISTGLITGFGAWLGFIAPSTMAKVIWGSRSWKLWLIDNGFYLISLLGAGAALATWPMQ